MRGIGVNPNNHRTLKNYYEKELGKEVSDSSWYRVMASIRACGDEVNKDSVLYYAQLKKVNTHLPIELTSYREIIDMSKKVLNQADFSGRDFENFLRSYIPYAIPKPSLYRFFHKAGVHYSKQRTYQASVLVPVLVNACVWALKQKRKVQQASVI